MTAHTPWSMAVTEEDLSLLPVPVADPKFVRAYENPRFVPAKGGAPVLAQVAPAEFSGAS